MLTKCLRAFCLIMMAAILGSFPSGLDVHEAFAGPPIPALESPAGEAVESAEDSAPLEALASETNPASSTEDQSLVPRVDELLQLKPMAGSPAARYSELLIPPAEIATGQSDADVVTDSRQYNVPIVVDPSVQGHIRYFNTAIRGKFEQWLLRLSRYRPLVESIFAEFNLPSDLVFLSLVESGFNPYAYSRAKATGPWQFMKGTAKVYGLRVDQYVDERRDPIKSTIAAARYLRDLYDLFGTWPLAMAAYNAGEGKVMRALQKAQAESFSEIAKTKLIRRETREYVPRFMAATIIAKSPDRYGFPQDVVLPHQFEEVVVSRPMHLSAVAKVTGVSFQELRQLNPELRRDATPPDANIYHLKVPLGTRSKIEALLDKIPTWKFPPLPARSQQVKQDPVRWYKVRVGDNLEKVAKRFGLSVKALKARNNLSGPVIRPGDFLVITR